MEPRLPRQSRSSALLMDRLVGLVVKASVCREGRSSALLIDSLVGLVVKASVCREEGSSIRATSSQAESFQCLTL